MTQHPTHSLAIPPLASGCTAQILLLLPPALFPDPSLISATTPGISASRSLVASSSSSIPNDAGWDFYEIEKAVGWSRLLSRENKSKAAAASASDSFDDRSQLTEAERARIRMAEQSKRGKVRAVTDKWENGEEFVVLASNEEGEEREERERLRRLDEQGEGTIRVSSGQGKDAAMDLAQEYRALLLNVDVEANADASEEDDLVQQKERTMTLQLHARYLPARQSKASVSLLSSILASPSSPSANYAEIRYPSPRLLLRCSPSGARVALNAGSMEVTRSTLLPSQWSSFDLSVRSTTGGRLLYPPSSRHSTWHNLVLPQPSTAHLEQVLSLTQAATVIAALILLFLTSRAAAEVRETVKAMEKRRKSQ